eukprot:TRINITY_DN6832_c0_g2_i1.p3 TRINITY_DN6832_c0_g2~~TRINITY_DN6832_c0_g2_i1.p3  ORF type:complete len:105 (-),score=12.29 TRINITY_DN6832_c0_g2_i1:541-855(-)
MAAAQNGEMYPKELQDDPGLGPMDLYPEDSYEGETYWADLPSWQRFKWMIRTQLAEDAREWRNIWRNFRTDPLSPFGEYSRRYVVPGMGLFTEGYVLGASCWKT